MASSSSRHDNHRTGLADIQSCDREEAYDAANDETHRSRVGDGARSEDALEVSPLTGGSVQRLDTSPFSNDGQAVRED
ncbi:hypothetical protein BP6252_03937 [Coleophoma cylindrospora]|uniref:Uncharacterized protein n=1 Tax=Coleophoma cylindrospora TaxID=1849047 RepID=A0A3D8S8Z1_9HELO|nr:hypothetical protein BP6252_03937 [Coleophoma cylindrospora]